MDFDFDEFSFLIGVDSCAKCLVLPEMNWNSGIIFVSDPV